MLIALATDFLAWSTGHDAHRAVRIPIHQFFSKPGLARLEGRIVARVQKLGARLERFSNTGMAVNLNNVFKSHVSGKRERERERKRNDHSLTVVCCRHNFHRFS
jgi:hypothetical protein